MMPVAYFATPYDAVTCHCYNDIIYGAMLPRAYDTLRYVDVYVIIRDAAARY